MTDDNEDKHNFVTQIITVLHGQRERKREREREREKERERERERKSIITVIRTD